MNISGTKYSLAEYFSAHLSLSLSGMLNNLGVVVTIPQKVYWNCR